MRPQRARSPRRGQAMAEYMLLMGTVIAVFLLFGGGTLRNKMNNLMSSLRRQLMSDSGTADHLLWY